MGGAETPEVPIDDIVHAGLPDVKFAPCKNDGNGLVLLGEWAETPVGRGDG